MNNITYPQYIQYMQYIRTLNGIGMSNRLQIILHVTKESWF